MFAKGYKRGLDRWVMNASWTTAMCMNMNLVTKESLCRPVSGENGHLDARRVVSILFSMSSALFYFLLLSAPGWGSFRRGADRWRYNKQIFMMMSILVVLALVSLVVWLNPERYTTLSRPAGGDRDTHREAERRAEVGSSDPFEVGSPEPTTTSDGNPGLF
jgi:hypothetical protein